MVVAVLRQTPAAPEAATDRCSTFQPMPGPRKRTANTAARNGPDARRHLGSGFTIGTIWGFSPS